MLRKKQILAGGLAIIVMIGSIPYSDVVIARAAGMDVNQEPMVIAFDEPLSKGELTGGSGHFTSAGSDTDWWQQLSLPIGNSYMGANIYGEIDEEHLTFNHKELWNGGPTTTEAHTGGNIEHVGSQTMAEYVDSVQNAFLNGDSGASSMCDNLIGTNSRENGAYQSWGDIYLDFDRDYLYEYEAENGVISDTSDRIRYDSGWEVWEQGSWEGGTEHFNDEAGSFTVTFYGSGMQMIGVVGPDMGDYRIWADGEEVETGTMNASEKAENQVLFEVRDLTQGEHVLTFESMVSSGGSRKTSFDYLKVLSNDKVMNINHESPEEGMEFTGGWGRYDRYWESDRESWYGQDEAYVEKEDAEGASLTYTFTGKNIRLMGAKGDPMGKFSYSLDGADPVEVDAHNTIYKRTCLLQLENLGEGEHTLVIRGIAGNKMSFDGFIISEAFEEKNPVADNTDVTNYRRSLNLDDAIAVVEYEKNHTRYYREYLASYPDQVIAMKLTAEKAENAPGDAVSKPLEFEVSFPVDQPDKNAGSLGKEVTYQTTDDSIIVSGEMRDNGLQFYGQLKVIPGPGGKVEPLGGSKETLLVTGASEVWIMVTGGTDYDTNYPVYRTGETEQELKNRVDQVINAAAAQGYEMVKKKGTEDYQNIYDRVKIDLGQNNPDITVDQMLADYKNGSADTQLRSYLETLMFQYGRYLQVTSTREGDKLPANLQGVWLDCSGAAGDPVAWGSDYHMNVNLQMNYWPTYVTNMAECAEPMIRYVEGLREPGRKTAQIYFGIDNSDGQQNGYMANTASTPFGLTSPGWEFYWGWSPAAVPWMLQNVYEAYEYSGDITKLKNELFPMMEEEAKFYERILKKTTTGDGKERYVTVPAYSPEHGPYTAGNVYENALVWQLFNDCMEAASALNNAEPGTVSEDKINTWKMYRDGLKPLEIGESGQIKEWFDETSLGHNSWGGISGYQQNHRHMSQLLGLYPGDLITVDNKEYVDAAKVTMNDRGDLTTGWGMAQRLNAWARTGDGNHAYQIIDAFLKTSVYSNLWDAHAPFQIDGNFGYTSGVAEMLMQSNAGYINLLPAMPEGQWESGSVSGLVARGNFEVSESWDQGTLTKAEILSNNGGECIIQGKGWEKLHITDQNGNLVKTVKVSGAEYRFKFESEPGKTYYLTEDKSEEEQPDPTSMRLAALIQKAEELLKDEKKYTPLSIQNLRASLEQAKLTAANDQAGESELNEAYVMLAEAMTGLVKKGSKEELINALDMANKILENTGKYLKDSIQGLQEVTNEAQSVYEDNNADTDRVGVVLKKLIGKILEARLIGDLDLNGVVDTNDSAILLKYDAEMKNLTDEQKAAADINRDGIPDSRDAVKILQYAGEMLDFLS